MPQLSLLLRRRWVVGCLLTGHATEITCQALAMCWVKYLGSILCLKYWKTLRYASNFCWGNWLFRNVWTQHLFFSFLTQFALVWGNICFWLNNNSNNMMNLLAASSIPLKLFQRKTTKMLRSESTYFTNIRSFKMHPGEQQEPYILHWVGKTRVNCLYALW